MQAYSYDPQTGEYLGEVECQRSPLEPGVLLLPGHATKVQPPQPGEHETVVWTGDAWELRPDYRGLTYYHKRRPEERLEITEIGVYPDAEWTEQDPAQVDLRYRVWDDARERWEYDAAAKDAENRASESAAALAYLQQTDWMVIRQMETGKPVPADVLAQRQAARAAVTE